MTSIAYSAGKSASRMNVVAVALFLVTLAIGVAWSIATRNPVPCIVMLLLGLILMQSPKIAQQWERAVVLRLGRFVGLRGPGLFWIAPLIDTVSTYIDSARSPRASPRSRR